MKPINTAYQLVWKDMKNNRYLLGNEKHVYELLKSIENTDVTDTSINTYHELLNRSEKQCLILRAILFDYENEHEDSIVPEKEYGLAKYPVQIQADEHELRVFMPYTFPRKGTTAVVMANYLRDAFYRYRLSNPDVDLLRKFKPPVVAIVKRKCNAKTAKRLQDNDNYEVSRYINVIMSEIAGNDSPVHMTFGQVYSTLSIEDDANLFGIEIVIFEEKDFEKHLDEFKYRLIKTC